LAEAGAGAGKSECVIGADVNPGAHGTSRPTYSVAVLCGEELVYKAEDATLERLVRLAWDFGAKAIAVDNPLELAPSARLLKKLVELLPEQTAIVWVNLSEGRATSLKEVAAKEGVEVRGKLSPAKTAYLLAFLAHKGVGEPVAKREEVTKIVVVKRKGAFKSGGMSADRLKRRARAGVLRVVKEIKHALDASGLPYELTYRRSSGGLEGAVFTVYAPRESLSGLLKPSLLSGARVYVKQACKLLLSKPQEKEPRPVIVGVDPGLNAGVAVLDLSGAPLAVLTKREAGKGDIVEVVKELGRPVVVATDSVPVPESVKKLAAAFNAKLFAPERPVPVEEKSTIAALYSERYGLRGLDSHSRDALAAAYLAYRDFSEKLEKLEKRLREMGLDGFVERAKKLVVEGASISEAIEAAVREGLMEGEAQASSKIISLVEKSRRAAEEVSRLREKLDELKVENAKLRAELRRLRRLAEELQRELDKTLREAEARALAKVERSSEDARRRAKELEEALLKKEAELEELARQREKLVRALKLVAEGSVVAVPRIASLTKSCVKRLLASARCFMVFVDNVDAYHAEAVEALREAGCLAVLHPGAQSSSGAAALLRSAGIPCIGLQSYGCAYEVFEDFVLVDASARALAESERERLLKELEAEEKERFYKLFEEYRKQRTREVSKAKR